MLSAPIAWIKQEQMASIVLAIEAIIDLPESGWLLLCCVGTSPTASKVSLKTFSASVVIKEERE